jgi:hypothetical protein
MHKTAFRFTETSHRFTAKGFRFSAILPRCIEKWFRFSETKFRFSIASHRFTKGEFVAFFVGVDGLKKVK